jgi:hypothetical protein
MAKKKVELEEDRAQYHELVAKARSALSDGRFQEAIRLAASSWTHIDGMMQYERKYENREFSNIESIDIVLEYAPLLFEFALLDELESLLKTQRKIDRDASDDLAANLSEARTRMWAAHRLWNHLEKMGECIQDQLCSTLGGDQGQWRKIAETWETMDVIHRTPDRATFRLSFQTRMDAETDAKCPSCGTVVTRCKSQFLNEMACPNCRTRARYRFVFIEAAPAVET